MNVCRCGFTTLSGTKRLPWNRLNMRTMLPQIPIKLSQIMQIRRAARITFGQYSNFGNDIRRHERHDTCWPNMKMMASFEFDRGELTETGIRAERTRHSVAWALVRSGLGGWHWFSQRCPPPPTATQTHTTVVSNTRTIDICQYIVHIMMPLLNDAMQ